MPAVLKWALATLACGAAVLLAAGQLGLLRGTAPTDLGVRDGRLKRPSATPNSVSSQADLWPEAAQRDTARIAPLALAGDAATTMQRLHAICAAMRGAHVVRVEPDYLYVQFETRLLKFVDDAEFWADPAAGVVQVRSASRVGRRDFGVNRARIELIRSRLAGS